MNVHVRNICTCAAGVEIIQRVFDWRLSAAEPSRGSACLQVGGHEYGRDVPSLPPAPVQL
jgi:hypothetical protein